MDRQCSSCGGFCRKSGCERENVVPVPQREWQGLTDEEMLAAAWQAGFDIHEDYDNEDDDMSAHWWTEDGEQCDEILFKLRDLISTKLKEKNT